MRELKFRVWDKLAERFTTCDQGYQGHYVLSLKGEFHNLQDGSGGKEYIVQQYTGLKDKNGKEIYEGDIIKVHGSLYDRDSREDEPIGNFTVVYNVGSSSSGFNLYWMKDYRCEVVGNVLENPELLK